MSADGRASRRALLTGAGTGLAGAGALLLAGCGAAATTVTDAIKRQPPALRQRDVSLLLTALELERRTVAAYVAGIPLLPRYQAKAAEQFLSEEISHTGALIALLKAAGTKAPPRPNSFELGRPQDGAEVLALLHRLEQQQIAGYLRTIPQLSPGPMRAAVATILTVDSQHITMLRLLDGADPVPSAFVSGSE